MPLTRYELRNEYSLANPDLYRVAAKNDPEELLDGVAMAGLVGIVRQLGDLAEFAAEIFHDLHEEVLATATRGHELLIRMQQLEAELPFVEKLMVSERNYVNFAYNPGLEWHANIQNEQNHFTRGDLPRFIRNAYEDCRGPPRLFLLDKFDVAGAGACLKRYSDPSLFRMEWASSELMKAEKEQQNKKARRIKKKGRQQREMREASFVGQMQTRICSAPLKVEKAATSSSHAHISNSQHSTGLNSLYRASQGHEQGPESSRLSRHECDDLNSKPSHGPSLLIGKESIDSSALSRPQEPNESCVDAKSVSTELDSGKAGFSEIRSKVLPMGGVKISENVTDFVSETDNYMDALTTIESEVETDLDTKTSCQLVDKGLMPNYMDIKDAAHAKQLFPDHMWYQHEMDVVAETNIHGVHNAPEEGDAMGVVKPPHITSLDAGLVKEKNFLFTDVDLSSQKSSASMPDSGSLPSMPALENLTTNVEKFLESRSVNGIRETPETPAASDHDVAASDHDVHQPETFSADFHELPDSAFPLNNCSQNGFAEDNGSQNGLTEHISAVYSNMGNKNMKQPILDLSRAHFGKASFEDYQSDVSQGAEESSPVSSIQPMKWAINCLRHPSIILDSDDELDGMQVSSPSSSSSNSALSSPRPSTLATTVFGNKPQSPLSPLMSSPESFRLVSPDSPVSSIEPGARSSLLSGHLQSTSQIHVARQQAGSDFLSKLNSCHDFPVSHPAAENHDKDISAEGLEHFPPFPPLPPLKWRTTTRPGGLMSSSTVSDSSSRFPFPQKSPWRTRGTLEASNLPPLPSRVQLGCIDVPHAHEPLSTSQTVSQGFSMVHEMIKQSGIEEAYGSETNLGNVDSRKISLEEVAEVSGTVNEMVQLDIPASLHMSMPHEPLFIQSPEASFITDHPRHKSTLLESNEPTCFVSLSGGPPMDDEKDLDATGSLIHENCAQVSSASAMSKTWETNAWVSVRHQTSEVDGHIKSSEFNKKIPTPPMLEQLPREFRSPLPSSAELDRVSKPSMRIERKDTLIAAIASHDKSTLRKIPQWSQSSRTARPDDREVLLEQIRTASFSLRQIRTEKQETPRPVTNINVASILERANAIRQAFVGSDDDEDHEGWSDD